MWRITSRRRIEIWVCRIKSRRSGSGTSTRASGDLRTRLRSRADPYTSSPHTSTMRAFLLFRVRVVNGSSPSGGTNSLHYDSSPKLGTPRTLRCVSHLNRTPSFEPFWCTVPSNRTKSTCGRGRRSEVDCRMMARGASWLASREKARVMEKEVRWEYVRWS